MNKEKGTIAIDAKRVNALERKNKHDLAVLVAELEIKCEGFDTLSAMRDENEAKWSGMVPVNPKDIEAVNKELRDGQAMNENLIEENRAAGQSLNTVHTETIPALVSIASTLSNTLKLTQADNVRLNEQIASLMSNPELRPNSNPDKTNAQ